MEQNFFEELPGLLEKVAILEKPNDEPMKLETGDKRVGILKDDLAKRLWSLKQSYREEALTEYYVKGNRDKKKISIAWHRYNLCLFHFWNRVGEVMDIFGAGHIAIYSNWEIVITAPEPEPEIKSASFSFTLEG